MPTTTNTSILDSIGQEITSILSPVSICMLLVVLLITSLSPPPSSSLSSPTPIRSAATLVYLETPTDAPSQKLQGALLNALVFVLIITITTFLLVLLYYYKFTNLLKNYMRFSAFFVLAAMGGSVFLSLIQRFSLPLDAPTCLLLLLNFAFIGVLSVFSNAVPILLRQGYTVVLGVIVAAWFTNLPEWTTWVLLVALAVYDLVAVLAPGGPLKMLVELASSREDELPALVYEARPTTAVGRSRAGGVSSLGLLVGGGVSESDSVELQEVVVSRENERVEGTEQTVIRIGEGGIGREGETRERRSFSSESSECSVDVSVDRNRRYRHEQSEIVVDEERSPLVETLGLGNDREGREGGGSEASDMMTTRGIKLGLGDFVFYSVLVGRAAMYDLMTVYACYLAIVSGLGCTLILLALCHHALPALPISIFLGVIFYFLTRLLMEPFVVGTSTNLMMF